MGIKGLLPLLKDIQQPSHIKNFAGETIGIDAYVLLHKGSMACAWDLALGKSTLTYVNYCMHRLRMLRHYGVTPLVVFDGDYLPSKRATECERANNRQKHQLRGKELLQQGLKAEAAECFQKSIDVTPRMARCLIDSLRKEKIEYIVAPYEADAQLAYLDMQGVISAIASEDSDLLVYGCQCLITKLDQYGECIEIRRDRFSRVKELSLPHWDNIRVQWMAILAGCDYLPNVQGIGIKKANTLIRKYKSIERVLQILRCDRALKVPEDYEQGFRKAQITFLHQTVFCPLRCELVSLTPLDANTVLDIADQDHIGAIYSKAIAIAVARGDLDPMTKRPFGGDDGMTSMTKHSRGIKAFFKPVPSTQPQLPLTDITNQPSCFKKRTDNWEEVGTKRLKSDEAYLHTIPSPFFAKAPLNPPTVKHVADITADTLDEGKTKTYNIVDLSYLSTPSKDTSNVLSDCDEVISPERMQLIASGLRSKFVHTPTTSPSSPIAIPHIPHIKSKHPAASKSAGLTLSSFTFKKLPLDTA